MKKNFFGMIMFSLVLVFGIAITGCDNGTSDDDPSLLVGTWTDSGSSITFSANKTGSISSSGSGYTSYSGAFTWSTSGNTLTMTTSSGSTTMKWSVSGNKLTLTDPDGESMTLTKQ